MAIKGIDGLVLSFETSDVSESKKSFEDVFDEALIAVARTYILSNGLSKYCSHSTYVTPSEMVRMFVDRFIYKKPYNKIFPYRYDPSTIRKYCKLMESEGNKIAGFSFAVNCMTGKIEATFIMKEEEPKVLKVDRIDEWVKEN